MSTNVVILQLVLLGVVLESDLGRKKVGLFRVLRPVVTVILIVPFFFTSLPTGRNDLLLQGAGVLAGALLGLFCMTPWFVKIGWDPAFRSRWFRNRMPRARVVTHAGVGYAAIWIVFTVARLWFAYGSQHEFPVQVGQFVATNHLSGDALTNAFIFLSIAMSLFRSVMLAGRAQRVRREHRGVAGYRGYAGYRGDAGHQEPTGYQEPASMTASAVTGDQGAERDAGNGGAGRGAGSGGAGRGAGGGLLGASLAAVAALLSRPLDRQQDRMDRRQDRWDRRRGL
ncbi:MAG: hypothetical protein JO016_03275 [Actinobacteria bacterium]|nr:hypothetical protein [Actinomycetota bacterium]